MLKIDFIEARRRQLPITKKIGDENKVRYIEFLPGINEVDPEDWKGLKETNKNTWHYYGRFFKVIGGEAAEEEGVTDEKKLSSRELLELIESHVDERELQKLKDAEIAGERRKNIMKAIDKRIAYIHKKVEAAHKNTNY